MFVVGSLTFKHKDNDRFLLISKSMIANLTDRKFEQRNFLFPTAGDWFKVFKLLAQQNYFLQTELR